MRWTPLLGLLMLGCEDVELPSQYAPYTLLPGNNQTDAKYEGSRRDWVGDAEVEEGTVEGAFSVELDVTGERVNFEIRSALGTYDGPQPEDKKKGEKGEGKKGTGEGEKGTGTDGLVAENPNGLDLIGLLHEDEGVTVRLEEDGVTGDISLMFEDDQGIAYLTEVAGMSDLSQNFVNGNFVMRGESLGTTPAGETEITLYTARVSTDTGIEIAYPGFPIEIDVLDNRYQFLLVANWERTSTEGQDCPIDERLAYEMVRLDDVRGFDQKKASEGILRDPDDRVDGGGCVATGG